MRGDQIPKQSGRFRPELLPPPRAFYAGALQKLRLGRKPWATALCPFHPDSSPSLSVNLDSGGFYCFACGAKGGDVVDFVRQRYGLDFVLAAKYVGAWDDKPLSEAERSEFQRNRRRALEIEGAAEHLRNEIRYHRHAVRAELHLLERLYRSLKRRLNQLHRGKAEKFPSEMEFCLDLLASTHSQIRERSAAYYLLSFASSAEQENYVKHPECRKALIDRVLSVGYVRDDRGRYMAVEW